MQIAAKLGNFVAILIYARNRSISDSAVFSVPAV